MHSPYGLYLSLFFLLALAVDAGALALLRAYRTPRKVSAGYAGITALFWIVALVFLCIGGVRIGNRPLVWTIFSLITLYSSKILFMVFALLGLLRRLWGRRPSRVLMWSGVALGALLMGEMWWGVAVTRHRIEVKRVEVDSDRLPEAFDGFRIVQFSDLHADTWGSDTAFVSRLVDSINSLRPDIILFTGDIVSIESSEILPFVKPLSRLRAPFGVWSVLGNHDYGNYRPWDSEREHEADTRELVRIQEEEIGWRMLNNASAPIVRGRDTLMLIGVENWGEPPFPKYGDLAKAYPTSSDSRFKILLSHNPMHWSHEVSKSARVDLTLSGHTHAMQAAVKAGEWEWSPAKYKYPEWSGLYSSPMPGGGESSLYVNIGSGEVGFPARFGSALPEVTLLTLRRR